MRSLAAVFAAAVIAGALTACSDEPQYADAVCVDRTTNVRVDDRLCDQSNYNPMFIPWYLTPGQSMFGIGTRAPYGSAVAPQGYQTRAPFTPRTTAKPPTAKPNAPSVKAKPPIVNKPKPAAPRAPSRGK